MVSIGPARYTGPSSDFYADAWVESQGTNHSHVRVAVRNYVGPAGSTGSYFNNWGQHWAGFDNYGVVVNHSANPFMPGGYPQGAKRWEDVGYIDFHHDANGYHPNVTLRMHVEYGGINQEFTATLSFARIPKAPAATINGAVSEPTPTSLKYQFSGNGDGGSGIIRWEAQWSTTSDFSSGNGPVTTSSGTTVFTGLVPGTTHYFRSRGVNAVGNGPWGAFANGLTLPSVPPGLTITASPSGQAATLTFTPPGGVTGVTPYLWERRLQGTTTPVDSGSTPTTIAEVSGLTPGLVYEWRGSAMIGVYQSPWTGWIALQQPKPNTAPGDYFDGSSLDLIDVDYGWTGTVNNSVSQGVAPAPAAWENNLNSGAAVMMRATAGLFGTYAARVIFSADTTTFNQHFGQSFVNYAEVTENAKYFGSIHVKTSRSQHMAAMFVWMDNAGTVIGTTTGTPVVVGPGVWTRLMVNNPAPAGAHRAIIRATDVTGTGWSVWHGGDTIDLDGAMISLNEEFPYFDGDTPDTETYVYEWSGEPNASESTRTPVGQVTAGSFSGPATPGTRSLVDPDCAVVPAPPRPPSIPSDCIEDIGVWRRYYVQIPSVNVSDWLSVVLTLEVITGAVAARQVRIRVYPNPFDYPVENVDTTEWCAEQIISYMPAFSVLTLDGVTQRTWANVNDTGPQSADHLLYGTGGQPPTWPILSCGISYLVSLEVPVDAPEGNVSANAFVTTRT
jgi:hypothetical protein